MSIVSSTIKGRRRPVRWGSRAVKALFYTVLVLYTAFAVFPLLWALLLSFRNTTDILNDPYALPETLRFFNYARALAVPGYFSYYVNSIVVVSVSVIVLTVVGSMAAYYFGRFRFRGRELLFAAIFAAIMIPQQAMLLPLFELLKSLHLLNKHLGLICVYVATSLPLPIYILSNYFATIPSELSDAARMDGCSEWRLFWRIMFPMARPAVAAVVTFNTVRLWNEYLYAVVLIFRNSLRTLPLGLVHLKGEHHTNIGALAAAFVLGLLPLLAVYLVMSEQFMKGMAAGAVKG